MSRPTRPFLGESAENRIKARRRALIDHAFTLISLDQWRGCSIAQLCRDTELNKRYFYESFQSLNEVEDAVVDDLVSELLNIAWKTAAEALTQGLNTDQLAQLVLKSCIAWLVDIPSRANVLFSKTNDNPRAQVHRDLVTRQLAQALTTFGLHYHRPRQPQVALTDQHQTLAKLGSALLIGGTAESILLWVKGGIDMSLDEFSAYIAQFWVALGNVAVDIAVRGNDVTNQPASNDLS